MAIYFIDYENVHVNGLNGLEKKGEETTVVILYSKNCDSLNFNTHRQLMNSKASIEYIKVEGSGKNSLDFQLSSYLGFLAAKHPKEDFFIISKDTGYNNLIEFWKKRNIKLSIAYNLLMESKQSLLKKITEALPQHRGDASKILAFIEKYKTKQGINNALVKEYGSDKAGIIYKGIKPLLTAKQTNSN